MASASSAPLQSKHKRFANGDTYVGGWRNGMVRLAGTVSLWTSHVMLFARANHTSTVAQGPTCILHSLHFEAETSLLA